MSEQDEGIYYSHTEEVAPLDFDAIFAAIEEMKRDPKYSVFRAVQKIEMARATFDFLAKRLPADDEHVPLIASASAVPVIPNGTLAYGEWRGINAYGIVVDSGNIFEDDERG